MPKDYLDLLTPREKGLLKAQEANPRISAETKEKTKATLIEKAKARDAGQPEPKKPVKAKKEKVVDVSLAVEPEPKPKKVAKKTVSKQSLTKAEYTRLQQLMGKLGSAYSEDE
jgi:hypothetical protein